MYYEIVYTKTNCFLTYGPEGYGERYRRDSIPVFCGNYEAWISDQQPTYLYNNYAIQHLPPSYGDVSCVGIRWDGLAYAAVHSPASILIQR